MENKQTYDKVRRVLAFVFGVATLITSLYFSKTGFAFKVENADIWWVGWVIAGAVTAAQFMFNTERKELDWTIVVVGMTAYIYSIWSNIEGWESLRGIQDYMNWAGGIFMDVFPEKAIAWSLGAIKVGDFLGNIFSIVRNPTRLDEEMSTPRDKQTRKTDFPSNLPRKNTYPNPYQQAPGASNLKAVPQVSMPYVPPRPTTVRTSQRPEPTYHPIKVSPVDNDMDEEE